METQELMEKIKILSLSERDIYDTKMKEWESKAFWSLKKRLQVALWIVKVIVLVKNVIR